MPKRTPKATNRIPGLEAKIVTASFNDIIHFSVGPQKLRNKPATRRKQSARPYRKSYTYDLTQKQGVPIAPIRASCDDVSDSKGQVLKRTERKSSYEE